MREIYKKSHYKYQNKIQSLDLAFLTMLVTHLRTNP